jgi:hypothetical protein
MFDERAVGGSDTLEATTFFTLALGLRFETHFTSEPKWWPASMFEVAEALLPYHRSAKACVERMLNGEELCSRLAVYRIARRR